MRRIILILLLPLFVTSCGLSEFFDNRDYGFLSTTTRGVAPMHEVRKTTIFRNREETGLPYEGVFDSVLIDDVSAIQYSTPRIGVRGDGDQVFVAFERAFAGLVRVFSLSEDRERLDLDTVDVARDAALTCDFETITAAQIRNGLTAVGIDPDSDYQLTVLPFAGADRVVNEFRPLGWTQSNLFVIRIDSGFRAQIDRNGERLTTLFLQANDLFISYNTVTAFPTCATEAPAINPERLPYADSTVLNDTDTSAQIILDGERLYAFPAEATTRPRHLRVPAPRGTFFGPFN